jgi:hypothetical protein
MVINKEVKMRNDVCITLDLDWAPNFVIYDIVNRLLRYKIKATFFVTHLCPIISLIGEYPDQFELGIHPNFRPDSTQGTTVKEILDYCMYLVPDAVSMRTHSLVQSTPIFKEVMDNTPIKYDVSLFLDRCTHLQPTKFQLGKNYLTRYPYYWEDDIEMGKPGNVSLSLYPVDGLKIYDFHPLYIYLNCNDFSNYEALKKECPVLEDATPEQVDKYINPAHGVGTLFDDFLKRLTTTSLIYELDR